MVSEYSLEYWPFHTITFKPNVFSKIYELKTENSLYLYSIYLYISLSLRDAFARVGIDRQTHRTDRHTGQTDTQDRQTHRTSTLTLAAHEHQGLITMIHISSHSPVPSFHCMDSTVCMHTFNVVHLTGVAECSHRNL